MKTNKRKSKESRVRVRLANDLLLLMAPALKHSGRTLQTETNHCLRLVYSLPLKLQMRLVFAAYKNESRPQIPVRD